MTRRAISTAVMTLGLVASSVATGHAGGGAGTPITDTFFDCYEIQNGADSPYTLALTDRFGDHQEVKLRRSRLLCTPTSAIGIVRGPVQAIPPENTSEIKCYDIEGPKPKAPRDTVTLTDSLGQETIVLKQMTYVCTPVATDPPLPQ
jgi:hypothetical protein